MVHYEANAWATLFERLELDVTSPRVRLICWLMFHFNIKVFRIPWLRSFSLQDLELSMSSSGFVFFSLYTWFWRGGREELVPVLRSEIDFLVLISLAFPAHAQ